MTEKGNNIPKVCDEAKTVIRVKLIGLECLYWSGEKGLKSIT